MASKTDDQIAKENRLRVSRPDGVRAIEDAVDAAVVIRKNMARLRELRLAKEAEAASTAEWVSNVKPIKPSKMKKTNVGWAS
jgi:hypothetical protein